MSKEHKVWRSWVEEYFSWALVQRHVVILLTAELLNKAFIHWTIRILKPIRSLIMIIITSKSGNRSDQTYFSKLNLGHSNTETNVENRNQGRGKVINSCLFTIRFDKSIYSHYSVTSCTLLIVTV
jgi:hypothetical protein